MINPIDRTEDLVRVLAIHHGVAASAEATLKVASDDADRHPFTQLAEQLTDQIQDMLASLRRFENRYTDFSARGMRDAERDDVDSAVGQFVNSTLQQIDVLKQEAVEEAELERGASFPAHKLGVVVILNEELQGVSSLAERMRATRIRQALAERDRTRVTYNAAVARELEEEHRQRHSTGDDVADGNDEDNDAILVREFERENATLVNELVETREQVRQAERTVYAIANMNHLFATKVLEQAKEIETLYGLAVEATSFVQSGNSELRKMEKRGAFFKYILALLAMLLAFLLLFAEWVGRRRSLL